MSTILHIAHKCRTRSIRHARDESRCRDGQIESKMIQIHSKANFESVFDCSTFACHSCAIPFPLLGQLFSLSSAARSVTAQQEVISRAHKSPLLAECLQASSMLRQVHIRECRHSALTSKAEMPRGMWLLCSRSKS